MKYADDRVNAVILKSIVGGRKGAAAKLAKKYVAWIQLTLFIADIPELPFMPDTIAKYTDAEGQTHWEPVAYAVIDAAAKSLKKNRRAMLKPGSIPLHPDKVYGKDWKGWDDFLGVTRKPKAR